MEQKYAVLNSGNGTFDSIAKKWLNSMYGVTSMSNLSWNYCHPEIKKVIFNDDATIVFWNDNTKTVVKMQNGDRYDKEKGLSMAISKKFFDNKGSYYDVFKKWL